MSEWTEWAKQFETGGREIFRHHSEGGPIKKTASCLYARREGPHKVACNRPTKLRSLDNYPACERHDKFNIREGWQGYIEGA